MLVGVSLYDGGHSLQVSSITYLGQALTLVGARLDGANNMRVEIWRLINPPSGTTNIVATLNGNSDGFTVGAVTFTGVHQGTPLGTFASATGNSQTPSVNATSAANELVFDTVAFGDGHALTVGANQTRWWTQSDSGLKVRGAGSTESGAASVTMSWLESLGNAKDWAIGAVAIRPDVETTTTLSSSANPSTYGNSIIFTATVRTNGATASDATGNCVFRVDGTAVATNAVASGQATYTNTTFTAGSHGVVAEYSGNGSYTASTNTSLTQTVNPATVTVSSGLTANNKLCDGTTTATISSNNVALNGVLASDVSNVSLSTNGYVANFDTATVGTGKPVSVSGLTLTGSAAGNYALTQPTLTANITAGSFAKLQLLMPGETAAPGTGSGKTGSPLSQTAGSVFNVTVNAVDAWWNVISTNDTVALTTTDTNAILPGNAALVAGTKTLSLTFRTAGSHTVTVTDVTNGGIPSDTSPATVAEPGNTVFFDDFEDDTLGQAPVIASSSTGGADLPDMGSGWSADAGATQSPYVLSDGGTGKILEIGRVSSNGLTNAAATANFNAVRLDGLTKVQFDLLVDYTPSGQTTIHLFGSGAGSTSFHLEFKRGNSTTGLQVFNYSNGVQTLVFTLNNADEWRHVTLTLGPSNYNLAISQRDGTPSAFSATDLPYDNAAPPTTLTSIRFEDRAASVDRLFELDDVRVTEAFTQLQVLLPGETAAPGTTSGKTGTPTAQTVGTPFNVTVNAVDSCWNPVTNVTDTVGITSSDTHAVLPANAALVGGTGTFSATLKTAGIATVTATDLSDGTRTADTSSSLTVNAAPFSKLQLLMPGETAAPGSASGKTGTPTAQTVGVAFNVTVNAVDADWNPISTNDTVAITSTDGSATLPANAALVGGTETFTVTLKTAGSQTVTASDVTHPAITANTGTATTVNRGDQTITFAAIADQSSTNTVALSATASSGLTVTFAVTSGPGSIANGTNLTFTGAGSVTITASQAGDANWNAASDVSRSFNVNGLPVPSSPTLERWPLAGVKVRATTLLGTDPDGDPISLVSAGPGSAQGGTISTNTLWVFYTPAAGFTNSDSYGYVVQDSRDGVNNGTVTVNLTAHSGPSQNTVATETLGNGDVRARFLGIPGRTYTIQYTTNLVTPDWQSLGTGTASATGQLEFTDLPPPGSPTRTYRSVYP
jgi:hypothetical protein